MLPIHSSNYPGTSVCVTNVALKPQQTLTDVLADRHSDSAQVALIFKEAFDRNLQGMLNALIQTVIEDTGLFYLSEQVRNLLLDQGIELQQNLDGSVQMSHRMYHRQGLGRRDTMDESLPVIFPKDLIDLVGLYDQQVEISMRNVPAIQAAFLSADVVLKEEIIRVAVQCGAQVIINYVFDAIRTGHARLSLANVNLHGSDLTGLELMDMDLNGANLTLTNLNNQNLKSTGLNRAILVNAKLRHASLDSTYFYDSDLTGADLTGADLTTTYFVRSDLTGAKLSGAIWRSGCLDKTVLTGTDLSGSRLNTTVMESNLAGAILINTDLSDAIICVVDLTGADLTGASLRGALVVDINLTGAKLKDANLAGIDLKGSILKGADLTGADLTAADLTGVDLTSTILTGANLTNTKLTGATLHK